MSSRSTPALALLLGCLFAFGCGGGSGASAPPADDPQPLPPPGAPPGVEIVFPHVGGLTQTATIVVRGTATSSVGLASVTVAGLPATSSDGYAHWQAQVPLALGANTLVVQATDTAGATSPVLAATVERVGALPESLADVGYDASAQRLYVLDYDGDAVVAFDEASGLASVVSSSVVGSGPSLGAPYRLALDAPNQKLYVSTANTLELLRIDLVSGVRTLISGPSTGSGPLPLGVTALAMHVGQQRVYVSDSASGAVYSVDVASGARSVVSGVGVGVGTALGSPTDIVLDEAGGRAFVTRANPDGGAVLSVHLATGNRTLISDQATGMGTPFLSPYHLVYDAAADRCIVTRNSSPAEFQSVDLATGDRTDVLVSGALRPLGAHSVCWDPISGRLLVSDGDASGVRCVVAATGASAEVWRPTRGQGPLLRKLEGLGLLTDGTAAVGADFHGAGALVFIDLATGDRTTLSGTGPTLNSVSAMTLVERDGRALLVANTPTVLNAVVAVNLVSGDRTVLSGGAQGVGPAIQFASHMDVDPASGRIYVSEAYTLALLGVDPTTGDRTLISDAVTGSGPMFESQLRGLAWDALLSRVLVGTIANGMTALVSVDPITGARQVESSAAVGTGIVSFLAEALLVDAPRNRVVGTGAQNVLAFDDASGDRALLSGDGLGGGPNISYIGKQLAHAGRDQVVLMYDDGLNALFAVDTLTGERVIVAR